MKKIISLTVAILFLINNLSYALNVQPGSFDPTVRKEMYAGAQQLWRAKVGPGGTWLNRVLSKWHGHHFVGEKPEVEDLGISNIRSPKPSEQDIFLPEGWNKNPILKKKNLIEALECYRDTEAKIPAELLEIKEGYYELEKGKAGELPLARIEEYQYGLESRHRLIVHTKLVQMWNHIRANDVWFDYKFEDGKFRTISLAWGIFYRIAKHEMVDWTEDTKFRKSGGHVLSIPCRKIISLEPDEEKANQIGGRYNIINDTIWLWFLQSYCFYDSTRYNNRTFHSRVLEIFSNKMRMEGPNFFNELPNLSKDFYPNSEKDLFCRKLALAINYHFFSRKGIKVPKLTVDPKLIKEYKDREYLIVGKPMYAGGKNESGNLTENQAYEFKGKALITAGKISWSIKEKVDKLNQLIGQKAVTELTEDDLIAIRQELDSHWVTDDEFDEMVKTAGDEGKAFCKQVPREARMPFEMIIAIRESAGGDLSTNAFGEWLDKIFKRVETGELNPDVVEKTIVEMSTKLSSEETPTINDDTPELLLMGAIALKAAEPPNKKIGTFIERIDKKVENKILNMKRFKEEAERIEERFQKLTKRMHQSAEQKWGFEGKALITANKIERSIQTKVDKLNGLIGQKVVTELTEDDLTEIERAVNTPWYSDSDSEEIEKRAGEKGEVFCNQMRREGKLPFELMLAIREKAKDISSKELELYLADLCKKIDDNDEGVVADFAEDMIVKMFLRLSNEKSPTVDNIRLEDLLCAEVEWAQRGTSLLESNFSSSTTCKNILTKIEKIIKQKEYWQIVDKDIEDMIKDVKVEVSEKETIIDNIVAKVKDRYGISEDTKELYVNDLRGQNLEAVKNVEKYVEQDFLIFAQTLLQNAKSAHQDAVYARDDFRQSKVNHTTGKLDAQWQPTYDRYEEKRYKASNLMTEAMALVEYIEKVNKEEKKHGQTKIEIPAQGRDDKSQVEGKSTIISDHSAPLFKDEGPGVIKPLDEKKRKRVWQGVNASREENIEIFIPQSMMLTEDMEKKLIEVKTSVKKIGKVLSWERYSCENDGLDDFLETVKKNKHKAKRIVITEDETVPLLYAEINSQDDIAELFRDVKMINVCLFSSADEEQKTKWQMHLIMTALLARFLEPGDGYFNDIRILLEDMLEGCFTPNVDVKDFVGMLAAKEDKHTSIKEIRTRIKYFLLDTPSISLIEKLRVEWEAIKEFYKHL